MADGSPANLRCHGPSVITIRCLPVSEGADRATARFLAVMMPDIIEAALFNQSRSRERPLDRLGTVPQLRAPWAPINQLTKGHLVIVLCGVALGPGHGVLRY